MDNLRKCWYVDSSPGSGFTLAKCGEKAASVGISGVSTLSTLLAGPFSMTDTIVLNSFPYLVGQTVSVCLCGLDCGDLVVAADGSLTIHYLSDPGGLLTADYLVANSILGGYGDSEIKIKVTDSNAVTATVYVPCVVGYGYTSKGQLLRTVSADELKTPKGPGTGKLGRLFKFSMFLWNAAVVKIGTNFTSPMTQTLLYPDRSTELPSDQPFTGIHEATVDDMTSFDGQVCWQVDRPFPLGVVSCTSFANTEDR